MKYLKPIILFTFLATNFMLYSQLREHRDSITSRFTPQTVVVLKTDSLMITEFFGIENRYYFKKNNLCFMHSYKLEYSEFSNEYWLGALNKRYQYNGIITCPCGGKSKTIVNCKSWFGDGELVTLTYTNTKCETGYITIIHIAVK